MIIPSIDLQGGHAVQLVGGRELALDAGDPLPLLARFGRVGEVAVVDLDAALGRGENRALVRALCARAPCRVGGGIRDADAALDLLDAGAAAVVLGTAARPELLRQLPRDRVIAALDAEHGEVVVDGWRTRTGRPVPERMAELAPFVAGFLVTFVEREGRMVGLDLAAAQALRAAAGDRRLTVAGGVADAEEIAALDRLGIDVQIGMALYTGRITLGGALAAILRDRSGQELWPTVVCDELGTALGLCWSDADSLGQALAEGAGIYRSRRRGRWRKGATSGATQELLRIDLDCDRDALRFTVRQHGAGFCHQQTRTCWGDDPFPGALARRIAAAADGGAAASYTRRLLAEPALLAGKLAEEARELADACSATSAAAEAADLLYFAAVALHRQGADLAAVCAQLARRARSARRRPGNLKPEAPR